MQNKLVNFANEAVAINVDIFNKTITKNVDAGQKLTQKVSEHASDSLSVKSFDDFVANQKGWNALMIEQSQETVQSMVDLSNEAYDAYVLLWKKAFAPVVAMNEPKVVKAKAA